MEEALVALLLADAGLAALVGNRVTYLTRPQSSALPAITIQRIDGTRGYTMQGPDGLIASRVQFDCWGSSFSSAKTVARAIIAALSGMRGTHTGITFSGSFLEDEADTFVSGTNVQSGTAERIFRTRLDFILWHNGE